jgi:FHS family glucose/mannose:H+ symporter-like MFS transporter
MGLETGGVRRGLAGFFLSGVLVSLLGAILPAWGYHRTTTYELVAYHFFGFTIGILAATKYSYLLIKHRGLRITLFSAALAAFLGLLGLAAAGPPQQWWWRVAALAVIGAAAGTLHAGIFHLIMPAYEQNPAAIVNLAGIFFGLGCLSTALLVAGAFYIYTVASIVILLALIPGFHAIGYWRSRFVDQPLLPKRTMQQAMEDFSRPAAILFALLLFFQFGNEWALAGWLPLFLIQRLGISPETSVWMLAFYWVALLLGRVATQAILPRVSHTKLLFSSMMSAWFGCTLLWLTNNLFGATVGILMTGAGFATIYPLVVERLGNRFPYYHPGFFNGIFSLAVVGALLAPGTLGFLANEFGVGIVMALPLLGTAAVFVILGLLWLETKLSGIAGVSEKAG